MTGHLGSIMAPLRINLRKVLLAENEVVQRRFVSARRRRLLRASELEKLKITQDDLARMDWPQDTDLAEALRILGIEDTERENIPEDRLPADRIVHLEAIRRICTNYGLVFRPFRDYKGTLAKAVAIEVLKLKGMLKHDPAPGRFFITAPKEMFCDSLALNDPFLFYEIGPDEYYLVHQWGLDTSPLRLITHWPRGTKRRLFATRTVFCAALAIAIPLAAEQLVLLRPWTVGSMAVVFCCWLRFLWEFKHRRGVHERRWFQP